MQGKTLAKRCQAAVAIFKPPCRESAQPDVLKSHSVSLSFWLPQFMVSSGWLLSHGNVVDPALTAASADGPASELLHDGTLQLVVRRQQTTYNRGSKGRLISVDPEEGSRHWRDIKYRLVGCACTRTLKAQPATSACGHKCQSMTTSTHLLDSGMPVTGDTSRRCSHSLMAARS